MLFPSSKFLRLATLACGSSCKAVQDVSPTKAYSSISESGSVPTSPIGTVGGPTSSSDLALDADLLSPVDGVPSLAVSFPGHFADPSYDTSLLTPTAVKGTSQASEKISPCGHNESTQAGSPRLLADRIKESSLLEELGSPTTHVYGAPFILIPDDNIRSTKEEFKDFLFAQFPSDVPSMGRIIGVINDVWARSGPHIYVHKVGHGTYILKVTSEKTRDLLLSR